MNWNNGTPVAPGVYDVTGSKHGLRRYWHPATGFSTPWYHDDPPDIVARASRGSADRENVPNIRWREVPVAIERTDAASDARASVAALTCQYAAFAKDVPVPPEKATMLKLLSSMARREA